MFSHVYTGISDYQRAFDFYGPIMAELGWPLRFSVAERHVAAWEAAKETRPLFIIGRPYDGEPAAPGNGQMVALLARMRGTVDRCHALALAKGGTCEGPPGLRPHYHPNYYGAYFRDPDGNKICVCCHDPA